MSYKITDHLQVAAISYLTCDISEVIRHYLTETFGAANFVNSEFQLRLPRSFPQFFEQQGKGFQTPNPSDSPLSLIGGLWHWQWEEALESWVGISGHWEIFKGTSEWGAAAGGVREWAFVWVYETPVSSRIRKRAEKAEIVCVLILGKIKKPDKSVFSWLSSRWNYLTLNLLKYYGNWTKILKYS